MLGEIGTVPDGWAAAAVAAGANRGYTTLAWGFDAYDPNNFTDTIHPAVLDWLAKRINGAGQAQAASSPPP